MCTRRSNKTGNNTNNEAHAQSQTKRALSKENHSTLTQFEHGLQGRLPECKRSVRMDMERSVVEWWIDDKNWSWPRSWINHQLTVNLSWCYRYRPAYHVNTLQSIMQHNQRQIRSTFSFPLQSFPFAHQTELVPIFEWRCLFFAPIKITFQRWIQLQILNWFSTA